MVYAVSAQEYVAYADALKKVKSDDREANIDQINHIHEKLAHAQGSEECNALAQRKYLKREVAMKIWNGYHPDRPIHLLETNPNPVFAEATADERALKRYFELLSNHPKLRRVQDEGIVNIYEDIENIERVRKLTFDRTKSADASRIGVVAEDRFWIWIRDAVRSPSGAEHTFNRLVSRADLNENPGAAALPIQTVNGVKMISLQLAFRHATNSWEWEMPRGGSKPGETAEQTARREIREETGYELKNVVALGVMTPDSGLTASVVPIFLGDVSSEGETNHDKTEAIKGKHLFSIEDVKNGLKTGMLIYEQDGIRKEAPLRDPFLNTALLQAYIQGHLEL
jgi:ADP-ribose pyrophosphatase